MTEQAAQVEDKDVLAMMAEEAPAKEEPVVEPESVEQVESEAKAESAPAQEDHPAEPDPVQKRINKITADKYEQQRRADALEAELKALREQQGAPKQSSQSAPKLEDFDYDEPAYQAALIDYQINQRMSALEQQKKQQAEQERAARVSQSFSEKVAKFQETATDYVEVVQNIPQLPQETLEAVMSLDNGPQIAYYLGKHLDVADEIASASPVMAAMRLGEIRAQLANKKPSSKPSAAPAPVETLTAGGSVDKDLDSLSMDEIMKL